MLQEPIYRDFRDFWFDSHAFWFITLFALWMGGTSTFVSGWPINFRKMYTSTTLNRTFICERCNVVILLESDRNEHERITGHSRFTIHDLAIGREELECGENS